METLMCPNNTSDQNYSTPVPFIGLYIAAASLVCFLLIISDVIHGICSSKRWLPCRFFTLSSVSLTLLAIAAKLPVDLTTPMPTAEDQLSKVTGTCLLCVCMGFLFPSLGSNRESECVTNMVALSILVVTVIVNICIQIATGLIFSFIAEHITIMLCMISLLALLWIYTWTVNEYKNNHMNPKKDVFVKGGTSTSNSTSMLEQLNLCYLHSYGSNPQYQLCKSWPCSVTGLVCLICFVVVLQATFRSTVAKELVSCNGLSDYGWLMRVIVVMQLLLILVASLATAFRGFSSFSFLYDLPDSEELETTTLAMIVKNFPHLKGDVSDYLNHYFRNLMFWMLGPIPLLLVVDFILKKCFSFFKRECKESEGMQYYKHLLGENGVVLDERVLTKCMEDIKRWTSLRAKYRHLSELLSRRCPSQWALDFRGDGDVSCLYLVFLTKLVSISIPSLSDGLSQSLNEVFDIVHFVETKMNFLGFKSTRKCKLAKAMWMGKDFSSVLSKFVSGSRNDLVYAVHIIQRVKTWKSGYALFTVEVWEELDVILNSLKGGYRTIEELCNYMEQLFVDILHIFLSRLPCAIFKHVNESRVEEHEESVRLALKFLCQVQSLDGMVQWSFPFGSGITSLINSEGSRVEENYIHNHAQQDEIHQIIEVE